MQLTDRLPEPKYQTNKFQNADLNIENIQAEKALPKLFMNQSVREKVQRNTSSRANKAKENRSKSGY